MIRVLIVTSKDRELAKRDGFKTYEEAVRWVNVNRETWRDALDPEEKFFFAEFLNGKKRSSSLLFNREWGTLGM